jgi:hypothetical protein
MTEANDRAHLERQGSSERPVVKLLPDGLASTLGDLKGRY